MSTQLVTDSISSQTKVRASSKKAKLLDSLLFGGMTFFVCLTILLWRLPILTGGLYVPNNTYQFGTVEAGTRIEHTFLVRNLHPWPVQVLKVEGGCGCTKSFVDKEVPFSLKPFQSVQVKTALDTEMKLGDVKQPVMVVTQDNKNGTPLVLSGTVTQAKVSSK